MSIDCTSVPKHLKVMRAITGTEETSGSGDNPKIMGMRDWIACTYPEMAEYCEGYTGDDVAWCGLTEAFACTVAGIRPPFGPTDTDRFLWAQSFANDDGFEHQTEPNLGSIVVMKREGGGHVTTFEGWVSQGVTFKGRGGNQSDAINVQTYSVDDVIAWVWPRGVPLPMPGPTPEPDEKPVLSKGDSGPYVIELQNDLNMQLDGCRLDVDGDFGSATEEAVIDYQLTRGLEADGVVGPQTWAALDQEKEPIPPPPIWLTSEQQRAIRDIAGNSNIADYSWSDRGYAPDGYIEGMALAFATSYRRFTHDDSSGVDMAKANTGDPDYDALEWYKDVFRSRGMSISEDGPETLKSLYSLMLGLGMRESSGRHCEGRDMSASNTSSDTAEAGLFQTSYDARGGSPEFGKLFNECKTKQSPCYLDAFEQGVSCSSSEWDCYGSGDGYKFQELCKSCPVFAAETAAITLRNLRQHYGPINRKEAEVRSEAYQMFDQVQSYLDEMEVAV